MKGISPQKVRAAVKSREEDILRWAEKLIRFPSENRPPDGNEGEAQEFIAGECRKIGLKVDGFGPEDVPGIRRHPLWLRGRNYPENRKNVVALWRGSGGGRSLLLSGHIDVAPREPDNWTQTGPFDPVVRDGKLYGRGSADLKGGLAAAFWALNLLQNLGFHPRGDILFESVVDEEFAGGNGTLASRLRGHNADLAVLTEPTRMEVCPACLGAFLGNLTLLGRAGIPYMGVSIPNPILGAARAVELFERWQELWRSRNSHTLFNEKEKQLNVVLWNIDSKTPGEFTQLSIPAFTRLDWVVWCYPGMSEEAFYRQFNQFWKRAAREDDRLKPFELEITPDYHYVKPWETDSHDPAVQKVVEVFTDYTGKPPGIGGAPFSCDMAVYGEVGRMPTVILGPRGGNLHAPDEWVLVEDVYTLTGIFAWLAVKWCG